MKGLWPGQRFTKVFELVVLSIFQLFLMLIIALGLLDICFLLISRLPHAMAAIDSAEALQQAMLLAGTIPGSGMEVISRADAWVGRPLTPVSFAGVARRTTRRAVVYGGAAYGAAAAVAATPVVVTSAPAPQPAPVASSLVASLPPNCAAQGNVFVCGGHAYQPVMQGSTVVYEVSPAH